MQENIIKSYKWCFVPLCSNTTKSTPQKTFIHVPKCEEKRKLWCEAARRTLPKPTSNLFCCEDHFNLEEDMANYGYYKEMGGRIYMKPTVVPHKFDCQPSRKRIGSESRPVTDSAKKLKLREPSAVLELEPSISSITAAESEPWQSNPPQIEELLNASPVDFVKPCETKNVGVQVNIRPKYRSKSIYCNLVVTKPKCDAAVSPIKLPIMKDQAVSPFKIPSIPKFTDNSSFSSINTESYAISSLSEYVPSEEDRDNEEIDKCTILSVTEFYITNNSKAYLGIPHKWYWIIDHLQSKTNIAADHIKLTLMKIKVDDSFERLGLQFGITSGYASKIFNKTVPVLAHMLKTLIYFPDQSSIKKALPIPFRARYNNVQSIIDCLEIQIEKLTDAVKQSLTWSEYKKCNTLKYLISSTPDGLINFISKGYGGRITDALISEKCGILEKLPPGCNVMADRGFKHIETLLKDYNCSLIRPPSVSSSEKPSKDEVLQTKRIASLRIHIERVIKRVREFEFLKPHAVIHHKMLHLTDDIIVIVCALINLQSPIIRTS